jgi:Mn2+/Fe2+ NRAMP family transporter
MKKLLGVTLGIMTALGGFVDLGQIVFTMQAGALFGYALLWSVALGTAAIIIYMEMCGRVAVVAREPVFSLVRDQWGTKFGFVVLVASNLLNLITCAAELGGIAIVLRLLTGWPEKLLLPMAALVLGAIVWLLQFEWVERTFGLAGLVMITFAVSAYVMHPPWQQLARGLVPMLPPGAAHERLLYCYFAVGIFSAMLMEYEVHFYSSGALEEDWKPKDLGENFGVAAFGSLLGALLTVGLLALGALVFLPRHIFPGALSSTALAGAFPFGTTALVLALVGTLACISGASVETALSGGYNICQFFNFRWGKNLKAKQAPAFTATWVAMLVLATALGLSGLRPLQLVNISIVFGMVLMPLTYYPILRVAADRKIMGKHANGRLENTVGVVFLVLITIAALAAIPLMIATHSGQP